MLTTSKEIRWSSSENWWCWLCLYKVALLLLRVYRFKVKQILLSTVGFVMIFCYSKAIQCEFKILPKFSHVFHTSVPAEEVEAVKSEPKLDVTYVVYPATRNYPKYRLWERAVHLKL